MTIFEINKRIQRWLDEHINPETGEIDNIEAYDYWTAQKTKKLENIALYYKNTMAEAKAVAEEAKNLAVRARVLERKAESLKSLLDYGLKGEKFETSKVKVSYRKSTAVVVHDFDELPVEFSKKVETWVPDKEALKEALKEGKEVSGRHLEVRNNIQIK